MATIRKRGNAWEASVRRKGFRAISKSFPKKSLAERWAKEQEIEMVQGKFFDSREAAKHFIDDLADKYLKEITTRKSASSLVPETCRLNTIKTELGHYSLTSLTAEHVIQFSHRRLKTIGSDALRRELQLLSDLFNAATSIWNIPGVLNPVPSAKSALTRLRHIRPGARRDRRLTAEEYRLLTNAPHKQSTVINELIAFAIETAMRRGELTALRWEDVDLKRRVLRVRTSKTDHIRGEKGRIVPLSMQACAILEVLKQAPRRDGLVFGLRPRSVDQAFERVCKRSKVTDLRFHDLRHEATSRLFERGLKVEEVAAITGHSDWRSLKRYTHPDPMRLAEKLG